MREQYHPRYDYDRYPLTVLASGPRAIEAFDEWMLTVVEYDDMSEWAAEKWLSEHWPQIAESLGLQCDPLEDTNALFRDAG
jgi:hypothetical protein